jgi:microcystin-dependent protein
MWAWLTADTAPVQHRALVLYVPDDDELLAAAFGALLLLSEPENWEQYGTATADETADAFRDAVLRTIAREGQAMPVGAMTAYAGATLPDGFLWCDGSAVLESDYPALFAAIGTTYGTSGAGTFRLPDIQGRTPIGAGNGAGLTTRALGATGGTETHQLTVAEMPSHTHSVHAHAPSLPAAPGPDPVAGVDIAGAGSTGSAGGDAAHENMPPFVALNWIICYA